MSRSPLFCLLLAGTVAGEFLLPWVLAKFTPGYDGRHMVMSALGSPKSPARRIYNSWLRWLGVFLLTAAAAFFHDDFPIAPALSVLRLVCLGVFALGAGLIAGLFSVGESKEDKTTAAKIHGVGAAVGFMALLFYPLLEAVAGFLQGRPAFGGVCLGAFLLALGFFVCFVMADKEEFQGTALAQEGLWQRLTLFFMYAPLLYRAAEGLAQNV